MANSEGSHWRALAWANSSRSSLSSPRSKLEHLVPGVTSLDDTVDDTVDDAVAVQLPCLPVAFARNEMQPRRMPKRKSRRRGGSVQEATQQACYCSPASPGLHLYRRSANNARVKGDATSYSTTSKEDSGRICMMWDVHQDKNVHVTVL
ncbi:uncharacterized protein LOC116851011 [Odontomachus brunneus]|uniref:uncharacterized protein LOC116851011 n=1 Tax=Odontomachus brunneus TaxID=486640 RepID=UPI0013F27EE2|nr:uncharacterized protein LOC116851011 [Odontomachus brunneus]